MNEVYNLRKEYLKSSLNEAEIKPNPFDQFEIWLNEAIEAGCLEPHAMHIATVSLENRPSSRIVLLRSVSDQKFKFFTNYLSRKGIEINSHPNVSLLFFWPQLERQVRVEGTIEKLPAVEADEYFESRPRASQIAAAASPQSQIISDRAAIEKSFLNVEKQFEGKKVVRPNCWGGYGVSAERFEFWQGRPARLHDRLIFKQIGVHWEIERLAP